MSSPWAAPGSTDVEVEPEPSAPGAAPVPGAGSAPVPSGPRRELVQTVPLFPLRPLGLGEILGAAIRIYRVRPRIVLGVSAIVYAVATALNTVFTGASMIPTFSAMSASLEDPTAAATMGTSAQEAVLTLLATLATGLISMVAAALVTVALTDVSLSAAVGEEISSERTRRTMRRKGLPAIGMSAVIAVVSLIVFAVIATLGSLPLILMQEVTVLGVIVLLVGLLLAVLALIWIWVRTVLAVPALVVEDVGVLTALRRSLALTAGRRLWRTAGIALLVYLLVMIASQVIGGVFGGVAGLLYVAVLLATSFQAVPVAGAIMVVVIMIGTFFTTVLTAPFLSAAFVTLYADVRMRHEAWDVELNRRARASWDAAQEPT